MLKYVRSKNDTVLKKNTITVEEKNQRLEEARLTDTAISKLL
jgi:hypothetical protein